MGAPLRDSTSGANVVISREEIEHLKQSVLETAENTVEKVGEAAKVAIEQSVDMIPASSAVVGSAVKAAIAAEAPTVASIVSPVVDLTTKAAADISVEYLKPKVDPAVDASVDATKEVSRECISSI